LHFNNLLFPIGKFISSALDLFSLAVNVNVYYSFDIHLLKLFSPDLMLYSYFIRFSTSFARITLLLALLNVLLHAEYLRSTGRFWSDERGVPFLDKGDVKRVTFKYG